MAEIKYTNSPLVSYTKISPNKSSPRNHIIDTITIHMVVGQASVETLGEIFENPERNASSNYGVGFDGKIGMYCEERDRSWCSGSSINDNRAITIEVASDTVEPFAVRDVAYNATINLVADICKRNNIKKLIWLTDKNVRINHLNGANMTVHRDFQNTGCPGTFLYEHMGDIANKVNEKIGANNLVKEYKLIVDCNTYNSELDAQNKKNSTGIYPAGTYYIYNKYPDGVNGMYNITKDKTGNSAGAWINPSENVEKLYRVRKSKDDIKSQIGAYSSLDNAKAACQKAGSGYKVFDWDYKIVYEYKEPNPEEPENPENNKLAYDLDYTNPVKIIVDNIDFSNESCVKAIKKIKENNSSFNIEIAKAFFKIAPKYKVEPLMAISQSILETGWFTFKDSVVSPSQNNFCGLGATGGDEKGNSFSTIDEGVEAQCQHLFAYGTKEALPAGIKIVDQRFNLVTRGIAKYWQQLAGRWAVPGFDNSVYKTAYDAMKADATYGQHIIRICNQIKETVVSEQEVEEYFPKEETPSNPDRKEENAENVNVVLKLLRRLLEFFVDLFGLNDKDKKK